MSTKPTKQAPQRTVPREQYPPGKETALFAHLEIGAASVESLIAFNERAEDFALPHCTETSQQSTLPPTSKSPIQLHPAFVQLGMDFATGQIIGTSLRCKAFLHALLAFLENPGTIHIPENVQLVNVLFQYITEVSKYLDDCRASPLPLENIIDKCHDFIDQACRASTVPKHVFKHIFQLVTEYLAELEQQQEATIQSAQKHLKDGDVILTFGHSETVVQTLLEAQRNGLVIKVVVVDSKPLLEGKKLLHTLTHHRFECDYALITSLQYIMPQVSKVLLGAHAILSNGSLLSRSGHALVALTAKRNNKPVLVCCESYKFINQAFLDGICRNEIGTPYNVLLNPTQQRTQLETVFTSLWQQNPPHLLEDFSVNLAGACVNTNEKSSKEIRVLHQTTAGLQNEKALSQSLHLPNIKLLNLRYDLTPPEYLSALITNYDTIPPSSASVVVRESSKRKLAKQKKAAAELTALATPDLPFTRTGDSAAPHDSTQ